MNLQITLKSTKLIKSLHTKTYLTEEVNESIITEEIQ